MLRKQALIALTALGLTMGSGAALSAPVGLQGLAGATLQQTGATVEPVHYKKRRHYARRHFVHPRRHAYAYPRYQRRHVRRHFVHPHFARRHHFKGRHHFRARPRVHFGLSFGW